MLQRRATPRRPAPLADARSHCCAVPALAPQRTNELYATRTVCSSPFEFPFRIPLHLLASVLPLFPFLSRVHQQPAHESAPERSEQMTPPCFCFRLPRLSNPACRTRPPWAPSSNSAGISQPPSICPALFVPLSLSCVCCNCTERTSLASAPPTGPIIAPFSSPAPLKPPPTPNSC